MTRRVHPLEAETADSLFGLLWEEGLAGLAVVDGEGKFIACSDGFAEMIGYMPNELKGRTFSSLTHPRDAQQDVDMAEAVKRGDVERYQFWKRYLHKRGHSVWALLHVTAHRRADGSFVQFFSQALPATLVEPPITHGAAPVQPSPVIRVNWRAFARENWKWLLAAITAVVGWIIRREIEWRRVIETLDR